MTTQRPSRFLAELPTNRFLHHDCSNDRAQHINTIFLEWFGLKAKTTKSQVFTFGAARKSASQTLRPSFAQGFGRAQQAQDKQKYHGGWKKNQPVQHKKFGIGTVQKTESKGSGKIYLTIKFKIGTKKLDSQFVKKI